MRRWWRGVRTHYWRAHLIAPVWIRLPERLRWRIAHRLDSAPIIGRLLCWSSLVDAALTHREDDACDVRTPLGCGAGDCSTTCYWGGGKVRGDHLGAHPCSCYCGKFRFTAPSGWDER